MPTSSRVTPLTSLVDHLSTAAMIDTPGGERLALGQPEHVVRWWGPNGFTTPFCKMDVRPGDVFHYCMRSPEGRDYWCKGFYREIVEPERIVFTDFFVEEGNPARHPELPDWPLEMLVKVTFAEHEGKTKLTLQQVVTSVTASGREAFGVGREEAQQGWTESLDRLGEYVAARAYS